MPNTLIKLKHVIIFNENHNEITAYVYNVFLYTYIKNINIILYVLVNLMYMQNKSFSVDMQRSFKLHYIYYK